MAAKAKAQEIIDNNAVGEFNNNNNNNNNIIIIIIVAVARQAPTCLRSVLD
jgi:hypothetical protein